MAVTIRQVGPCFAGAVEGIDMRKPMTAEEVAAIHAGMDRYAVLVFRNQDIDDAQQLAFTQSLGPIEHAIGTSLRASQDYRLPTTFADVLALDATPRASSATAVSFTRTCGCGIGRSTIAAAAPAANAPSTKS